MEIHVCVHIRLKEVGEFLDLLAVEADVSLAGVGIRVMTRQEVQHLAMDLYHGIGRSGAGDEIQPYVVIRASRVVEAHVSHFLRLLQSARTRDDREALARD